MKRWMGMKKQAWRRIVYGFRRMKLRILWMICDAVRWFVEWSAVTWLMCVIVILYAIFLFYLAHVVDKLQPRDFPVDPFCLP